MSHLFMHVLKHKTLHFVIKNRVWKNVCLKRDENMHLASLYMEGDNYGEAHPA